MKHSFHCSLRKSFQWYHNWHDHPRHQHAHWAFFAAMVLLVFSFLTEEIGNFYLENQNYAHAQAAPALPPNSVIRNFNGNFAGIDPPRNPSPPGSPTASIFTPGYPAMNAATRAAWRQAYRSRGLTHFPIGPVRNGVVYHDPSWWGTIAGINIPQDIVPYLLELRNDGLLPIYFLTTDGICGPNDTACYQNMIGSVVPVINNYVGAYVITWEANSGFMSGNTFHALLHYTRNLAGPNKLIYVHFPLNQIYLADSSPANPFTNAPNFWSHVNSESLVNGILYQSSPWETICQVIGNIDSVYNTVPSNMDFVLFETFAYFWANNGAPESQGDQICTNVRNIETSRGHQIDGCGNGRNLPGLVPISSCPAPPPPPKPPPIDLSQVIIVNSAVDPRGWSITTSLTSVNLNGQTWPYTSPDAFQIWTNADPLNRIPPITHTLWMFFYINGRWYGSGLLGYYPGIPPHGPITGGNCGWYYNNSWAPMHNYPVKAGDWIGFMVTAGAGRVAEAGSNLLERSNILLVQSPYDLPTTCPGESPTTLPPVLYYVFPNQAQSGGTLLIAGERLVSTVEIFDSNRNSTIFTGSLNAIATEVTIPVPNFTPGSYTVRVGTGSNISNEILFQIIPGIFVQALSPLSPPVITGLNPVLAAQGASIEIIGSSLTPNVQFFDANGIPVNVTGVVNSDFSITTATIPFSLLPGVYTVGITSSFGSAISQDVLTVLEGSPGVSAQAAPLSAPTTQSTFQDLISSAFNYSIILVGIAVFIMIMWGGFLWLTSAANPSNISRAKGIIFNAILGAILLVSAYVILYTINPELVGGTFTLPGIGTLAPAPLPPPSPPGSGQIDACAQCQDYQNAVASGAITPAYQQQIICIGPYISLTPPHPIKSTNTCPFGIGEMSVRLSLLRSLTNTSGIDWIVTEGFPPTVVHASPGHTDGRAVDIGLRPAISGNPSAQEIQRIDQFCSAARQANFTQVLNEYLNVSPSSIPNCTIISNPGGNHVHLTL